MSFKKLKKPNIFPTNFNTDFCNNFSFIKNKIIKIKRKLIIIKISRHNQAV